MINITSKVTYPKHADKKAAYQSYLKNIKRKIKAVDMKGKKANVHFTCDGEVFRTEFKGSKVLITKIQKVIFGKSL